MRINNKVLVIILVVVLNLIIQPLLAVNNVQFYNLNYEYGISIRETNSICKDDYGFIWISSKMGIVRYTLDDIRTYQLPYESEDIISVRLVYKDGILYAYTNNGQIFKYNSAQDRFKMVVNISKVLRNPYISVNKLLVDQQKKMWLSSSYGLFSYDPKNGLKLLGKGQSIYFEEWFDATHFFYGTNDKIKYYNTQDNSTEDYYTFPKDSNYVVYQLFYDHESSTLWIGTRANGLFYLKKDGNGNLNLSNVPKIPNQPVLAIEANSDSTILVGIDGQGIWEVSKSSRKILNVYKEDSDDPHALNGNGVYDIYCDENKRVWICTYSGGVSYFDQANSIVKEIGHIVNNQNSLVNNDVNDVFEDSDGKIWFATNNGISCWEPSTDQWKSYYHNKKEHAQVFHALCEDNQGRIWAGSYSSGVYLLDRKSGKELAHYSPEIDRGFGNDFVFDIYKDDQGNIWTGGVNGDLMYYLNRENRFKYYEDVTVQVIKEYHPGQMLIGTTYGLLLLDTKTGSINTLVEGYLVHDILLRGEDVWLCTSGDGVIRYNMETKKSKNYTVESGLPTNFVNGIVESDGYLWLGTENGMCRLNLQNDNIFTFNSILPLTHVSFNSASHYCLRDGRLIWGTNKGAVIFDPKAIQVSSPHGRIFYQDLTISGQSIRDSATYELNSPLDSLKQIRLKYYQNTISLELIPIGVTSPGSKFSWKLDGLDKEWSRPSVNRILSYSNIPSGTYSLQIRMLDSSLAHIIDERTIVLHMIPPFWDRTWFRFSVFIFIAGLGVFLFAYYIDRLKKRHSEEKIRFFANTAHELRTSLTLIKGPIEELHKETSLSDKGMNYLHLASQQTQRLLRVVTQLMDFQKVDVGKEKIMPSMLNIVKTIENRVMMFKSYAESRDIELKFSSNCGEYVTAVDEAMIEKVIDNLISNAIKYSFPKQQVRVVLECSSNKWELEVKDQGIGIGKKAQRQLFREYYRGENAVNSKIVGSGIGLLLVKNYVTLHDGKVNCDSQLNVGSTFRITVPYNKVEKLAADQPGTAKITQPVLQPNEINSKTDEKEDLNGKTKMKVLIVEDNDNLREFLSSAMGAEFQIILSKDGLEAWKLIQRDSPDIVVSDIMMPKMDGFELCSKLKSTYETSHIPIILLTSLAGKAQQLKGLGLGADDYLTKPFDVTLLQQRVKSIIKNREVIREKALKIIKLNEDEKILDNELNDQFMKHMVEVVRENMANSEFSKDDFASAMNVSRSLLYKKVKSLTDQSPTDFIKSVRLDHALDLLKSQKYTITEISELCGFSSVSYFSTVFRKHYGKSPTQVI